VADKKESQDLCFVASDYRSLLSGSFSQVAGDVADAEGNIIGRHEGLFNYTIGQRYVHTRNNAEPLYVVRIDATNNTVTVGAQNRLYHSRLLATDLHWVNRDPPSPVALHGKIRYKSAEAPAVVVHGTGRAGVTFESPQRAITPGQAVVFYQGDEVLGGATIDLAELNDKDACCHPNPASARNGNPGLMAPCRRSGRSRAGRSCRSRRRRRPDSAISHTGVLDKVGQRQQATVTAKAGLLLRPTTARSHRHRRGHHLP